MVLFFDSVSALLNYNVLTNTILVDVDLFCKVLLFAFVNGQGLLLTALYIANQVKGRLEGGQIYTPAYVQRITAMVRGATRGITVPTNLPIVWNSLQQLLQDIDGASGVSVEGTFFQSIFNGLLKDGAVLGSLRAGVQWTPAVSDTFCLCPV